MTIKAPRITLKTATTTSPRITLKKSTTTTGTPSRFTLKTKKAPS